MSNLRFTDEEFRIEVVRYLDRSWQKIHSASQAAGHLNYTEDHFGRKFSACFGVPFLRYLKKLKLHRAAMEIYEKRTLSGIGKMAGFSNPQSFSKAFKEEFGLSPRDFMQGRYEIHDLPVGVSVCGRKVRIQYENKAELFTKGELICPKDIDEKELMQNCGYCFTQRMAQLPQREDGKAQVGLWWYDADCRLYYYKGDVLENPSEERDGMTIDLPADYYAVLSIDRLPPEAETVEEIYQAINALARFVLEEWRIINRKNLKGAGYTYERYSAHEISFCVPIYRRDAKDLLGNMELGPVSWIKYIDDHIMDQSTVEEIAGYFGYSAAHFRETFSLYYGIAPGKYIRKRKEYITKQNVEEDPALEFNVVDLSQYYAHHKDSILIKHERRDDMVVMGRNVLSGEIQELSRDDMVECIAYRLQEISLGGGTPQVVVWKSDFGNERNICLTGMETDREVQQEPGFEKIIIKGGSYIVVESLQKSDASHLVDTYRMLYRCAFYGWIKENWLRVDLQRLTFVRYEEEKLRFYVPVLEENVQKHVDRQHHPQPEK